MIVVWLTVFSVSIIVIITIMTIFMPAFIKKRILFCSNCTAAIFYPKHAKKEMDTPCRKCKKSMEWIEIPEDIYQRRVFFFRLIYSLIYPICFLIILFFEILPLFYWDTIILGGLIVIFSCIGILIVFFILDFTSKSQILNWARKTS